MSPCLLMIFWLYTVVVYELWGSVILEPDLDPGI